jgi:hypothetical protein
LRFDPCWAVVEASAAHSKERVPRVVATAPGRMRASP